MYIIQNGRLFVNIALLTLINFRDKQALYIYKSGVTHKFSVHIWSSGCVNIFYYEECSSNLSLIIRLL